MVDIFQNIPNPSDLISVSQGDIKGNFGYLNTTLGKDHQIAFGDTSADSKEGYHKVIHHVVQVADPAPIASVQQTYAKNYTPNFTGATPDTQLFSMTGSGGLSQLTGNDAESDGWVWLGGVLLQWGKVNSPGVAGTVTFKDRGPSNRGIPFPTNIFSVVLTLQLQGSITSQIAVLS